jgi:hypothetical protein
MFKEIMLTETNREAIILENYLSSASPSMILVQRYNDAILNTSSTLTISISDRRLLLFIQKKPSFLGFIDSGLAILNPYSEVRRRIYIMFSLLESSVDHTNEFLPVKRKRIYLLTVLFSGFSAICKALVGILLIKLITHGNS